MFFVLFCSVRFLYVTLKFWAYLRERRSGKSGINQLSFKLFNCLINTIPLYLLQYHYKISSLLLQTEKILTSDCHRAAGKNQIHLKCCCHQRLISVIFSRLCWRTYDFEFSLSGAHILMTLFYLWRMISARQHFSHEVESKCRFFPSIILLKSVA